MTVRWEPYLRVDLQAVSQRDLTELEHDWGVRLPEEYKTLVCAYQGMAPEPAVFNVGKGTNVFNTLLTIKIHEGREGYSVRRVYEVLKPLIPKGIFPFAATPGGEFICFDYRPHSTQPQIVFITTEASIYPVADSFTDFMNQLHE